MCSYQPLPETSLYRNAEERISDIISEEARVWVDPKLVRLIIKYRWDEISKAAHQIHGSGK